MNLCKILLVVVEYLTSKLQSVICFFVSRSHQHFQPLELQLSELELIEVSEENSLTTFEVSLNIRRIVNHTLDLQLELSACHFRVYLLLRSQFVGIVNIDEMRFDVVRNRIVVLRLPELSLPRGTSQTILPLLQQLHHNYLNYKSTNSTTPIPKNQIPQ